MRGEFDVVVALYHDQGLGPLKTVDFDSSVNVTLGLPYVRTSPDHGTAFGLAGKGLASRTSFANAVALARRLLGWPRSADRQVGLPFAQPFRSPNDRRNLPRCPLRPRSRRPSARATRTSCA